MNIIRQGQTLGNITPNQGNDRFLNRLRRDSYFRQRLRNSKWAGLSGADLAVIPPDEWGLNFWTPDSATTYQDYINNSNAVEIVHGVPARSVVVQNMTGIDDLVGREVRLQYYIEVTIPTGSRRICGLSNAQTVSLEPALAAGFKGYVESRYRITQGDSVQLRIGIGGFQGDTGHILVADPQFLPV